MVFGSYLPRMTKENKIFINTIYLTGSLNDPQGKGGLAHLLEHLAFKGTQNVKGEEFQRRLDQYTLMTNASTDYYSTKYTNIVRPEKLHLIKYCILNLSVWTNWFYKKNLFLLKLKS